MGRDGRADAREIVAARERRVDRSDRSADDFPPRRDRRRRLERRGRGVGRTAARHGSRLRVSAGAGVSARCAFSRAMRLAAVGGVMSSRGARRFDRIRSQHRSRRNVASSHKSSGSSLNAAPSVFSSVERRARWRASRPRRRRFGARDGRCRSRGGSGARSRGIVGRSRRARLRTRDDINLSRNGAARTESGGRGCWRSSTTTCSHRGS